MRFRFLKDHLLNYKGEEIGPLELDDRINYLIRMGVLEEIKDDTMTVDEPDFVEKVEKTPKKEKKETKGLPTAKRKKK